MWWVSGARQRRISRFPVTRGVLIVLVHIDPRAQVEANFRAALFHLRSRFPAAPAEEVSATCGLKVCPNLAALNVRVLFVAIDFV